MPPLRVRDPRAELGQRHPAVPIPCAVHAVHDAPADRTGAGRASVSGHAHTGAPPLSRLCPSRCLAPNGDTAPCENENYVHRAAHKLEEAHVNPETTSTKGSAPSAQAEGDPGDCRWRCDPRHAQEKEAPTMVQGHSLHCGLTLPPCMCSISGR